MKLDRARLTAILVDRRRFGPVRAPVWLALLLGAVVLAVSCGGPTGSERSAAMPDLGDLLLRLGLVITLAVLSLAGLRRYLDRQGEKAPARQRIRLLDRCRVGPQQSLYVVVVDDRKLLIGATATTINTLAELGPAEMAFPEPEEDTDLPFSHHLRALGTAFTPFLGGSGREGWSARAAERRAEGPELGSRLRDG